MTVTNFVEIRLVAFVKKSVKAKRFVVQDRSIPSHLCNSTHGRWLQWIVLLHFVICWKSERFWFLWQHLSLHCIKNMATVITRRKRNNRPWSSPTCDGYSITYSQMGADRLLVCSLYFYYTRFLLICQVIFILAKTTGTMVWHFLRSVIYEILEGIPKTVGGSLSLGESAVAISAGRRAGRFRLPEREWVIWNT